MYKFGQIVSLFSERTTKALEKLLSSSKYGNTSFVLKMAHFSATVPDGHVNKGQGIGTLVMEAKQWKIAYQITTQDWLMKYQIWSPTVFLWDQQPICVLGSPFDCVPELNDFPQ